MNLTVFYDSGNKKNALSLECLHPCLGRGFSNGRGGVRQENPRNSDYLNQ
jgi:hypothetical protein